jgi:hypothetical protein
MAIVKPEKKKPVLVQGISMRPEHYTMLCDLAEHHDLSRSAVVQQLIEAEHKTTFGGGPQGATSA